MLNVKYMSYGAVVEMMRDFCGSFNSIRNKHRNNMLMYLIPSAISRALAVEKPTYFGEEPHDVLRRKMLHDGFLAFTYPPSENDPTYEATNKCINDWLTGIRTPEDFTADEIAYLCDVFYIDAVPAAVELAAIRMMKFTPQ